MIRFIQVFFLLLSPVAFAGNPAPNQVEFGHTVSTSVRVESLRDEQGALQNQVSALTKRVRKLERERNALSNLREEYTKLIAEVRKSGNSIPENDDRLQRIDDRLNEVKKLVEEIVPVAVGEESPTLEGRGRQVEALTSVVDKEVDKGVNNAATLSVRMDIVTAELEKMLNNDGVKAVVDGNYHNFQFGGFGLTSRSGMIGGLSAALDFHLSENWGVEVGGGLGYSGVPRGLGGYAQLVGEYGREIKLRFGGIVTPAASSRSARALHDMTIAPSIGLAIDDHGWFHLALDGFVGWEQLSRQCPAGERTCSPDDRVGVGGLLTIGARF